ncbi:MAG TPA: hypothetical protein VFF73_30745 [Planctomycetota bacterium]|nr:hypothetical protein [Planctomycetota bacterium]
MDVGVRERESREARCAYCHDAPRGALVACASCGALLHAECRSALGRCTTLGCASGAVLPTDGAAPLGVTVAYRPNGRLVQPSGAPLLVEALTWLGAIASTAFGLAVLTFAVLDTALKNELVGDQVMPILFFAFAAMVAPFFILAASRTRERGLRLVAKTTPVRRFVTLARIKGASWALQFRARAEDISPSETVDVHPVFPCPPWIRSLTPLTPVSVYGLEREAKEIAIVDASGRMYLSPAPRRVDR